MTGDDYRYDAFISYRHAEADKRWVRTVFVPALEAHGLEVCVDHKCFRLGAPIILEMERAVKESRYTVAVLTPAYLEGNFAELENVMAEHLGLEEGERRLLSVMREQCDPSLRMRARLYLEMMDDAEFAAAIERLVAEIRTPPDA